LRVAVSLPTSMLPLPTTAILHWIGKKNQRATINKSCVLFD
jgi:hypothetical protein